MKTDKVTSIAAGLVVAVFILLPFHALFTTWLGSNLGYIDLFKVWKEVLITLLAFPCLYLIYSDKKLKSWFLSSKLTLLIACYILLHVVIGSIALINDAVNSTALLFGLIINLRFLIFFTICLVVGYKFSQLQTSWARYVLWPAALVVLFGLLQLLILSPDFLRYFGYGPNTIPTHQTVDLKPEYIRLQSFLRGPNPLGAYMVLVITGFVAFLYAKTKKMTYVLLSLISLIVLFFTYSRSAWIGATLSLVILSFLMAKTTKQKKLIITTAISLSLLLGASLVLFRTNNRFENTFFHTDETSQSSESSNEARARSLEEGARSVIKQPLGGGPGTAGPASYRNDKSRIAENYFIQVAQEVGLIGLGLFISINIIVARFLFYSRQQLLSKILLASLVGLTFVNLLSHAWTDDTISLIWWGLAGITLSSAILNKERKPKNATT